MPEVRQTNPTKWARRSAGATDDYKAGIGSPRTDWQTATSAAEGRWKDGITKAAERGAFRKGVTRRGTDYWQARSQELGPSRYAQGVASGEQNYADGVAPFTDVIRRTQLPPRYPKGDPRNLDRVKTMAEALHKAKLSRTTSA
jgi:hypothetical protein